jgi:septal ring factor EnvC (AmiA/AmiB activator)
MSHPLLRRIVRRGMVLALTVGVIALGVGTVQVAAQWRADAAPLDTAPVGMETISADYQAELDRAEVLGGQVAEVAGQLATLRGAVLTADESVTGDSDAAHDLQAQLARAKAKLEKLQGQLKAAQARLQALNAAAARQAARNAATRSSGGSAAAPAPTHEHEDGTEEPHDD